MERTRYNYYRELGNGDGMRRLVLRLGLLGGRESKYSGRRILGVTFASGREAHDIFDLSVYAPLGAVPTLPLILPRVLPTHPRLIPRPLPALPKPTTFPSNKT